MGGDDHAKHHSIIPPTGEQKIMIANLAHDNTSIFCDWGNDLTDHGLATNLPD